MNKAVRMIMGMVFSMAIISVSAFAGGPEETGKQWIQKAMEQRASQQSTVKEALQRRVNAYWNARIKDEMKVAYGFIYPPLKNDMRFDIYAGERKNFKILGFKVENILIDPNNKTALVLVEKVFKVKPGVLPVKIDKTALKQANYAHWVLYEGEWYMRYELSLPGIMLEKHHGPWHKMPATKQKNHE